MGNIGRRPEKRKEHEMGLHPGSGDRQVTWKVFSVLVAGALVGSLAIIPYAITSYYM